MGAIDTNVLLRCIVRDDAAQCDAVAQLRKQYQGEGQVLFVPGTVLLEFEWVLRSRFQFNKDEVINAMSNVLNADDLRCDREAAMADALNTYKTCDADLADCMHERIAASEGQGPLHTFDRRAARLAGARLLKVSRRRHAVATC